MIYTFIFIIWGADLSLIVYEMSYYNLLNVFYNIILN